MEEKKNGKTSERDGELKKSGDKKKRQSYRLGKRVQNQTEKKRGASTGPTKWGRRRNLWKKTVKTIGVLGRHKQKKSTGRMGRR